MGRFVAGLLSATAGSEFQRVDCAPRSTLGDGQISAADYTQAGRYVAGLDPLTQAGGPLAPSLQTPLLAERTWLRQSLLNNPESAEIQLPRRGSSEITVAVTLEATGQENTLSASLHFDPAQWQFVTATLAREASQGALFLNEVRLPVGDLGFVLALPPGQQVRAGTWELLRLTFKARQPGGADPLRVRFHDAVLTRELVDPLAHVLQTGNQLRLGLSFASPAPPERHPNSAPSPAQPRRR
jgi:hypothetical protein